MKTTSKISLNFMLKRRPQTTTFGPTDVNIRRAVDVEKRSHLPLQN